MWKEIQAFSLQLNSINNQVGTCEKDTAPSPISEPDFNKAPGKLDAH